MTSPDPSTPHGLSLAYLYGLLGLAIVNGIFSPLFIFVFALKPLWYPWFIPSSPSLVLLFSALMTSTLTLMAAGIPAALYERFSGKNRTEDISLWIWMIAMTILSLPAVLRAIQLL